MDEIRALGAELAIVGNGAPHFAAAFREDFDLRGPLLCDPDLVAYRAAGLRRGRVEMLSPRVPRNALRALAGGYRQTSVEGDPWQLGGLFVFRAGGELVYRHASREMGDHPPPDDVLAALEPDAPALAQAEPSSPILRLVGHALGALIDPTVAASFAAPGFAIHSLAYDPEDLDVDLRGRHALVTGANRGIGFETALALADLGADVTLLCRNAERADGAVEAIRARTGSAVVRSEVVDLSSLASVRECAALLAAAPVDLLIHGAGGLCEKRVETKDGLEQGFAVHVAGPHLLTRLLRPALERASDARVVWISSPALYTRPLELGDPQWRERTYHAIHAHAEARRAQVVLARRQARELEASGVAVHAMHPGWVASDGLRAALPGVYGLIEPLLRTPAQGADTALWLAAAARPAASSGRFWFDRRARPTHLLPWTREDESARDALWETCQRLAEPFARA